MIRPGAVSMVDAMTTRAIELWLTASAAFVFIALKHFVFKAVSPASCVLIASVPINPLGVVRSLHAFGYAIVARLKLALAVVATEIRRVFGDLRRPSLDDLSAMGAGANTRVAALPVLKLAIPSEKSKAFWAAYIRSILGGTASDSLECLFADHANDLDPARLKCRKAGAVAKLVSVGRYTTRRTIKHFAAECAFDLHRWQYTTIDMQAQA